METDCVFFSVSLVVITIMFEIKKLHPLKDLKLGGLTHVHTVLFTVLKNRIFLKCTDQRNVHTVTRAMCVLVLVCSV